MLVGPVVVAQQLRIDYLPPMGANGRRDTRGDVVVAEAATDLVTELVRVHGAG